MIAPLIHLLRTAAGFHVARGKNRFAPGYDASDSAGYRDVQLLVRTPDHWLIEIQIIPAQMFALKQSLGHTDYTRYRFVIEAGKRARAKQQQKQDAAAADYDALPDAPGLDLDADVYGDHPCAYMSARGNCKTVVAGGAKYVTHYARRTTATPQSSGFCFS